MPAGRRRQSDLHEFLITPRNTALVTSYEVRTIDLSRRRRPGGGQVIGGDRAGARAAERARALRMAQPRPRAGRGVPCHVPGQPLDYFHVNSIDITVTATCSSRPGTRGPSTRSSRKSGEVLWRLGGKRSDFAMGKGTVFAWQHDARHHGRRPDQHLRRRRGAAGRAAVTRALIRLDGKRGRATLVRKYTHRPGPDRVEVHGQRAGARQRQRRRRLGQRAVHDGVLARRRDRARLEAAPRRPELPRVPLPLGRASDHPSDGTVYRSAFAHGRKLFVSWNGATEVASWQLLAGATPALTLFTGARFRSAGSRRRLRRFRRGFATPPWSRSTGTAARLGRSRAIRV